MASFGSPTKPHVRPIDAAQWRMAATDEKDAAKRLELLCATLDSIETQARRTGDGQQALASCIAIADVSLGDVWSEARRACARGVAKVPLGENRAKLAAHFGTQLDALDGGDWRRYDGLCRALMELAVRGRANIGQEAHTIARKALPHAQPTVRQAAAKALDAAGAGDRTAVPCLLATISCERDRWLAVGAPAQRERRAAALAGLLEGANVLIKNHASDDMLSDSVHAPASLLGDGASTVRQGAAEQLQRLASKSLQLAEQVVGLVAAPSALSDWRRTEGSLMTYDAVLSDEASRSMMSYPDVDAGRTAYRATLLRGALRWLRVTVRRDNDETEPGAFEVRRAARQLAHSCARAEVAFVGRVPGALALGLLRNEANPAVAARLLHHACSFLRYVDEALMDAQRTPHHRRWGLSHEGAGGDSESVEQSERAVVIAVARDPDTLAARIEAFRPNLVQCVRLIQLSKPVIDVRAEPKASPIRTPGGTARLTATEEHAIEQRLVLVRGLALCACRDGAVEKGRFGAFVKSAAPCGSDGTWPLLSRAPSELRRLAEPALAEFVSCLPHPAALAKVGPALLGWLMSLEGDHRGDRERPTSRKHVAEALCVVLRGALCALEPTGRAADHACGMLQTVFRGASYAATGAQKTTSTFAVTVGACASEDGRQTAARAAAALVGRLAPAWARTRRTDGEGAARLAALSALACAVAALDAVQLRAAHAALVAVCPSQPATPPRTPVKAPRPALKVAMAPPETPVTPLSPCAADPIDDWDDWDDEEAEEPVVAVNGSGLASLVDAVRADLAESPRGPSLSFF